MTEKYFFNNLPKYQANYLCDVCKRTFARSDMLTRQEHTMQKMLA